MTRGSLVITVFFAAILAFLEGCAAVSGNDGGFSSPMGRGPVSETRTLDGASATRELAVAARMVKGGQYSLVIPRLEQLVSQYPADPAAVDARYYLGVSYYNVGGYGNALDQFRQYQELQPEGPFAASTREYLQKLTVGAATPGTPKEIDQKIQDAKAKAEANPEDMAAQLNLANVYWDAERYEDAGNTYRVLIGKWPHLMDDTVVRTRMVRESDGRLTVLSPQEAERRMREQEPLLIYNVAAFRSGRFENWSNDARERFYNVTGQAVNRGEKALDDVRVTVTIYGFGQMVYDTQEVSMGRMQPGEVRAFSAQFSRFDNINNISRHECRGTFRR